MSIGENICKYRKLSSGGRKVSKAIYVHAIYNLAKLLSDDPAWIALRDTSVIDDFYFEKRI